MRAAIPARRAGAALIWLHRNNVAISQWQNPQFAEEATSAGLMNTASRRAGMSAALSGRAERCLQRALLTPRLQRSNTAL